MLDTYYLVLILVAAVAWLLFVVLFIFPRVVYKVKPEEFEPVIQEIKNSGQLLLADRCGGRIGWVNFAIGFLKVEIYSTGVIIKPFFLSPCAVRKEEITVIEDCRCVITSGVKIKHTSEKIRGSIILFTKLGEKIRRGILGRG